MKKLTLTIIAFFLLCGSAQAANKYAITGGGNWSGATWNTASGQVASNTTAPGTGDVAIIDAASGAVTVDTTTCVAASLNAGASANALTISSGQVLTVTGGTTSLPPANVSGSGTLVIGVSTTTCALTTNGASIAGNFTFAGTGAKTLTGNMTVSGLYTKSGAAAVNGAGTVITCAGGVTLGANHTGTTKLKVTGGTYTGGNFTMTSDLEFAGNVTISSASNMRYGSGSSTCTMTYTSGTITTTGSTLVPAGNSTLNTNGIVWNNITPSATLTITLTSDLTLTGLLTYAGATTINGAFIVHAQGGINTSSAANSGGTATLSWEAGTWTGGSGTIANNLVFLGGANTLTLSGYVRIAGGTMTYTSGTVDTPGGQLILGGSVTMNIGNSINFSYIGTQVGTTVTLSADLYCQTVNTGNGYNYTGFSGATINGYTLYCKRFIHGSINDYTYGTTVITIDNNGILQMGYNGSYSTITNPIVFAGSATMAGANSQVSGIRLALSGGGSLTQTSGSLSYQTGTYTPTIFITGNTTINTVTTIPNLSFYSAGILTMGGNLTATNTTVDVSGGAIKGAYTFSTTLFRQASGTEFSINPDVVDFAISTNLYVNGADNTTTTIKRPSYDITPTTKSGKATAFNFPDDYTVAFWMKDITLAEEARLVQVESGTIYIIKNNGLSRITLSDGVAASSTLAFDSAVDTTVWHSFVISKSGTTASLYIDAALQTDTATVAASGGFAGINAIAGNSGVDGAMPGTIKELVITSDAKDQAWATAFHNSGNGMFVTSTNTPNIFSLWHFNEGAGTSSLDWVGGRNLTWAAAPTYTQNNTLATIDAKFTYTDSNANQKVFCATLTDLDNSGGNLIYDYHGTVTSCTNIKAVTGSDVGGAGATISNY